MPSRWLIAGRAVRAGDALMMDTRNGFVYERIAQPEVNALVLEEVPDISYADIGGLSGQIEQIQDAVELPFLHRDLYAEHQLRPPKGVLLLRPARVRQDPDRQGSRRLVWLARSPSNRAGPVRRATSSTSRARNC